MAFTLRELAEKISAELKGDGDLLIEGVATLSSADAEQISFLANSSYRKQLGQTKAAAVVLAAKDVDDFSGNCLICDNPHLAFSKLINLFHPPKSFSAGIAEGAHVSSSAKVDPSAFISATAVIEAGASIGANSYISPGVVVSENTIVGNNCLIHSNVSLCHNIRLGDNVIVHSGAVIGSDGFGIANDAGVWKKIAQIGSVVIEDDVEIGANTTIDRGALEDTVIENGVKIDNQVHIAHNCRIGEHTAIAGCAGISGSTHIGKRCMIGGASAFAGHLQICDDVIITGYSMVTKSVNKPGMYSSGMPLKENLKWRKNIAHFNNLEVITKRLKELEKKLEE